MAQSGFTLESAAMIPQLAAHIQQRYIHKIGSHNGGLAVQLAESAIGKLMVRVVDEDLAPNASGSQTLTRGDFQIGSRPANGQASRSLGNQICSIYDHLVASHA